MQAGVIMTQHMDRLPHKEGLSDQHSLVWKEVSDKTYT